MRISDWSSDVCSSDLIDKAAKMAVDAVWIGRDLGYRGGRRTGLALTDDIHVEQHAQRWSVRAERQTVGEAVAERTAAVIWGMRDQIEQPVCLWNGFPLRSEERRGGKEWGNPCRSWGGP